jgi:hypothetical protein
MKQLFRELVFITLCGILAVIVIQVFEDCARMWRQGRAERRARLRQRRMQEGTRRYE